MKATVLLFAMVLVPVFAGGVFAAPQNPDPVGTGSQPVQCVQRDIAADLKGEIEAFFSAELAAGKSMPDVIAAALAKFADPADVLLVASRQGAALSVLVQSARQAKVDDARIADISTRELCFGGTEVAAAMGRNDLPGLGYTPAGGSATGAGRNTSIGGTPGGGNVSKSTGTPVSPSTF